MLFNEYCNINNGEYVNYINTQYGEKVFNWIIKRFKRFELLYSLEAFRDLFDVAIMESDILLRQIKNTDNQLDDLLNGTITTTTANSNVTNNALGTNSYSGYNVEGDFTKSKSNSTIDSNSNGTSTTKSTLDDFIKMLQSDLTTFYNKLYDKLIPLFVTII